MLKQIQVTHLCLWRFLHVFLWCAQCFGQPLIWGCLAPLYISDFCCYFCLGVFGSWVFLWFLLLQKSSTMRAKALLTELQIAEKNIGGKGWVSEWAPAVRWQTGWQSGKNHNGMRDKKNQQQHIGTIECRSQSRRTNSKINLESLYCSCNWISLNLQTQKAWIKVSETIWKWNITFLQKGRLQSSFRVPWWSN